MLCTQLGKSKEELESSNFVNQYQEVFTNDISGVLPPKRGNDDYKNKLILEALCLTRLLIEFDKLKQEEIMRQMNKSVDTEMMRPSSSPL